ncbi:MAG: hydrogenase maturation nickel metallochaperone HypA [Sulfuricurvum sp.]|nr:hydrogenase maturation nickel metallochaperone HypA [Sulfuricurvum sp.]
MHEYSIVQALLNQCEDLAKEHHAQRITKVVIKIGQYSGVEPYLLETAFDTFKEKTICEESELVMNIQPLVIVCNHCGKESILEKPHYLCSYCESIHVRLLDGEEMMLMSLEME